MIKYLIFDLDGTLLYTLESILYHLNSTLEAHSLKKITIDQCSDFIGDGARKLVTRAVAVSGIDDADTVNEVLSEYNAAYNSDPLPHTYPYEYITELVDSLKEHGIILGVVTNKPEPTARQLVEHFFPGKFTFIKGGREGAVLKPDPSDSIEALAALGGSASECAFVGDTSVDIRTAENMGAALSVGVSWGFRSREELIAIGADVVVDLPREIIAAIGIKHTT